MAMPKKIKSFNMFIEGEGFAGRVDEVTLPKLSRKMEGFRGGGMNAEVDIDQGMEKLETEINLGEIPRSVLNQFGVCDAAGVKMRFRAASQSDSGDCAVDTTEVVMMGRFKEIDPGSVKSGDDTQLKLNATLAYYRYSVDGEDVIEIDVLNMIEKVDGVDRLKEQRDAIGL
ncbi:MAG: phage major tail tube protein [Candidatus Sedimenticola sp. (ex Thyasira tokunagai)]